MASQAQDDQIAQVKGAIAALEAQRATLGDSVVDASLAALHKQLAELEGQAEQPEQQRKLLTILFTDVVGSTPISRQLDPEELLDTMDAVLKRLAKPVEDHGGRVTRFQGDGFKAVFGLPVARENDPEMAVRAGLGILEASRGIAQELERERGIPGFQVRVGINTGLVASGGLTEGEDTIGGEAINLAARLESAAPPGGLLISHHTYRHVRGVFNVVPGEPVAAKGFPEPVSVYLVHSAKPRAFRVQSRGVEGVETRMVGREAELKLLQDALLNTMEDSEGQVVTVLGEPGVGKSRLLYEFQNWIELLPQTVRLFLGRARPETQNLPYALLRDLFASRFRIQEGDPLDVVREKFERGIGDAFQSPTRGSAGEVHAHLIGQLLVIDFSASPHLVGLLGDAHAIHNRALESLVEYFSAVCRLEPAVIFLEDLHWADDSSLDVINFLGRRSQNLPLTIVGLARPSLIERRPHWGEGQLYHHRIHLEPLSRRESRQLVEEILQKTEQVPTALRELIVSGAEGNPFYIEELVKMLVEQGVIVKDEPYWLVEADQLAQVDVPSTLTGVLQARLDGLPTGERTVLQQASVVGRVFWDLVVEHLHNHQNGEEESVSLTLSGLRDKEMVYHREESIFASAQEYVFKHEVLREVTYETVLKKLRRRYHGWVADWLIEQVGKGGEEYSGLIADHLELAGRGGQARAYLQKAGEAALASYANAEAAGYFRRSLDLDPPEEERPALLGGLAQALQRQGYQDEAHQVWHEGISLFQAQGDLEGVAWFYTAIERSLLPDWPKKAFEIIEIALPAVEGLQENRALGHLLHQAARAYLFNGQGDQAEILCQQALEIASHFDDLELQADALVTKGVMDLSEPSHGIELLTRAVELAEPNQFLYVACRAHHNLGVVYSYSLSNSQFAIIHFQKALEIARERGSVGDEAFELEKLLMEQLKLGNIFAAENYLKELERTHQKMPQPELMSYKIRNSRAIIAYLSGDFARGLELYNEDLVESRRENRLQSLFGDAIYQYLPLLLDVQRFHNLVDWGLAEEIFNLGTQSRVVIDPGEAEASLSVIYSRQGRIEEARQWLQRALELSPPNTLAASYSISVVAKLELAIAEERWEDAISESNSLLEWFNQGGMRWDQAHTLLEMAEIHRMRGQPGDRERALELYNQAREIFSEIGATGYVDIIEGRLQLLN
jgi:class 3 adenylate cyclase/tetratricopeptide (TPR) repeat protein